ncbi:MAG: NADH:flavin oxidoreductase/NADH oxidase [Anaerolineales bacterium]|jgi:2,4-dienoyl-CoA reductase-like NADH-dependent reductase (Old Yellow Enzyme family)|nr:NADH:flavin oxidoreductase/NADH oxidase [Anaerolineales bacterium]
MPHLFSPLTIKGITLRNRIGFSPMCMYSYTHGFANDWLLSHLGARAVGGAGLVIAEATAIEAQGRISPHDLGIWSDEQIAGLARVTGFIKENGAVAGIQIGHAGRKAGSPRSWDADQASQIGDPPGWPVVGPSPIAFSEHYRTPRALSVDEIREVQLSFRAAAVRAQAAGFEWLEIHAAHGYLIHSFYSPLSNQRTDQYGGSFENRIRFLLETVRAIRPVWPERLPLTVRISGSDWVAGGWTVADSVELSKRLKAESVDLIDCSSGGGAAEANIPVGAGYQVPISEAVRQGADIRTATVGLITAPAQADEIIRNHRADLVLLGREMLRDPYWPLRAAQALNQPLPTPPQYLRGF